MERSCLSRWSGLFQQDYTLTKKHPVIFWMTGCFCLLHQISQHRMQDAAIAVVIDFDIGVQKHLYFEFDNLASGFFRTESPRWAGI